MGYIVLDSKFKPFSYQEMLAPIMQAQEAHDKALKAVESIKCDNLFYRRDIGWRVL